MIKSNVHIKPNAKSDIKSDITNIEMSEKISFGTWLRQRRRMLDLNQQAFADQVGCARSTLRQIESDTLKPSKELALILLKKLDIPESEHPQWIAFARGLANIPTKHTDSSSSKSRTNLPAPMTTFIGRGKEKVEIINLINKHRLITLTGSGGVGKTRLSTEVGEQVLDDYPNGIWLAELASLSDPALLPQTVAKVFGLITQSHTPILEILVNFLRAKTILLILDNCEHLLDACGQLTDTLLKNCPDLKILATSREPMNITGEAIYHVPSLAIPNVQQILDHFKDYESVRLFVERAQLAQTDFSLTMDNASFVAQICSRLDGIPLALELAAAKVASLSVKEIAKQLETNFNLLTDGSRTALPRQQTIRASIEWSWNLLSNDERVLMRQLSVFAGGWTLEAAQKVCDGDVVGLINSLVKKSLVALNQVPGSERRFRFHETIRQYAREKLIEANEEENIRTRHLKYFLELSEYVEPGLHGYQHEEWITRIIDERDNMRVALEQAAKNNVEAGLYISSRLEAVWETLDMREGARWLADFLQKPESKEYPRARARALGAQAKILNLLRQSQQAKVAAEESLALCTAANDQAGEIDALIILGQLLTLSGDRVEQAKLFNKAVTLSESLDDKWMQAVTLLQIGMSLNNTAYWEKAAIMFRELGAQNSLAKTLDELGWRSLLNGNIELAQKYMDESELLWQANKRADIWMVANLIKSLIAFTRADYKQARSLLQEIILVAKETGNRWNYLWTYVRFGYIAVRENNVSEARQIFVETAQEFLKDKSTSGVEFTLEGMAGLFVALHKPEPAARLIGWADATREKITDPRPLLEQADVDKIIAACLAGMGEVAFSDAYDEGKKMTMDEAVALALEEK